MLNGRRLGRPLKRILNEAYQVYHGLIMMDDDCIRKHEITHIGNVHSDHYLYVFNISTDKPVSGAYLTC